MQKKLLAALLGAIVVMIWGFISWTILPWHSWGTKTFSQDGQAVAQAMKSEAIEPGVYFLPNMSKEVYKNPDAEKQWQEKAEKGPFAVISVKPAGTKWDMKVALVIQFIIQFIAALVLVWLLSFTLLSSSDVKNALFIALAVGLGAFITNLSNWNWWGFPVSLVLVNVIDVIIAWFIAGLLMSKIMRYKSQNI